MFSDFLQKIINGNYNSNIKNIHLDNAASTPVDDEVLKVVHDIELMYSNPSGIYKEAVMVKRQIEEARASIARHLNVHSNEIIFTGSATESINLALMGVVRNLHRNQNNKNKIKVLTTNIEHPATLECLRYLEREGVVEMLYLKVNNLGLIELKDLRELLNTNPDIALISIIYASNEIGAIQPIKEIGKIVKDFNASNNTRVILHTDATQAINYLDVDVRKLRVDMLSFNGAKIYGPKGAGVLYKNKNLQCDPIVHGGGQEFNLRSGTEDASKIVGLSIAFQKSLKLREQESLRLIEIRDNFIKNIQKEIPEIVVWGDLENRLPNNINLGLPGILSEEMVIRLGEKGFNISHKSSCASEDTDNGSYVLQSLGASSQQSKENIRITMGRRTESKDMNDLILAIKEIYLKYRNVI